MQYLKHRYSKRIYVVMTDHGEEHPYLRSSFYTREISKRKMKLFFKSLGEDPKGVYSDSNITIDQELDWERRQLMRKEPLRVRVPSGC